MTAACSIPEEPALVSVIIPARDAEPTLDRTITALRAQRFAGTFQVIVVDDGSNDRTRSIAQAHAPFVLVIAADVSHGPGGARNLGVAAAQASILAFTDADCFPHPDWLEQGYAAIADTDLVQGRVEPDPTVVRTPFDRTLQVGSDEGFYQTANLFLRREYFEAVGGFRDWALDDGRRPVADRRRGRATLTPIGEDTLLAWSARRRGARSTYAAEAIVYHAVVPGGLRDEMVERWHWSRDMPGLVRLVPELRKAVFHHQVFFNRWTAQFDLAFVGLLIALVRRRPVWLLTTLPYAHRLAREARRYNRRWAPAHMVGSPVVEATTLAAFLVGGLRQRRIVL